MATHDYVIANGTGAAVRSDLNNALAAIVSNNSGSTEPGTTYAYQWWADTNANVLKIRNSANNAWITLRELDGTMLIEDGTAAAPGLAFNSDTDTGIYRPSDNEIAFTAAGVERMSISATSCIVNQGSNDYDFRVESNNNTHIFFVEGGTDHIGIGTSSPSNALHIHDNFTDSFVNPTDAVLRVQNANTSGTTTQTSIAFTSNTSGVGADTAIVSQAEDGSGNCSLQFWTDTANGMSEKVRIDSSGRLLVGTSSVVNDSSSNNIQSVHTGGSSLLLGRDDTSVTNGNLIGAVRFFANDPSGYNQVAKIICDADGAHAADDYPTRLEFYTTADGASTETERMRIDSSGNVLTATTSTTVAGLSSAGVGHRVSPSGIILQVASNAQQAAAFNRTSSDGAVIGIRHAGTEEGSISVSGSTVSYNGAHLSRWSQLAGGAERIEILRGSVLSNLDEMCEWGDEDNEQLNRMKVSDVEGDVNVSGVFQAWDDDDDTYTNDFYCAMTGDFIIRIAQGTTVARGDLLMSAGDGTAKPQDDDIVRSKTIAKVTSTTVSTTYSDGSYCVPCVLMAC